MKPALRFRRFPIRLALPAIFLCVLGLAAHAHDVGRQPASCAARGERGSGDYDSIRIGHGALQEFPQTRARAEAEPGEVAGPTSTGVFNSSRPVVTTDT